MQPGTYYGSNIDTVPFLQSAFGWLTGWMPSAFRSIAGILIMISMILSILFIIGIVYCVERLKILRKREDKILNPRVEPGFEKTAGDPAMANRWKDVTKNMESANQSDWRQAIMEADIILDDILTKMGYRGESVGEKLKRVDKGDFASLDAAWDAHKVRNLIAHEGSNFKLDEHEARRVIQLYKVVFEEFYYI